MEKLKHSYTIAKELLYETALVALNSPDYKQKSSSTDDDFEIGVCELKIS